MPITDAGFVKFLPESAAGEQQTLACCCQKFLLSPGLPPLGMQAFSDKSGLLSVITAR